MVRYWPRVVPTLQRGPAPVAELRKTLSALLESLHRAVDAVETQRLLPDFVLHPAHPLLPSRKIEIRAMTVPVNRGNRLPLTLEEQSCLNVERAMKALRAGELKPSCQGSSLRTVSGGSAAVVAAGTLLYGAGRVKTMVEPLMTLPQ